MPNQQQHQILGPPVQTLQPHLVLRATVLIVLGTFEKNSIGYPLYSGRH